MSPSHLEPCATFCGVFGRSKEVESGLTWPELLFGPLEERPKGKWEGNHEENLTASIGFVDGVVLCRV